MLIQASFQQKKISLEWHLEMISGQSKTRRFILCWFNKKKNLIQAN